MVRRQARLLRTSVDLAKFFSQVRLEELRRVLDTAQLPGKKRFQELSKSLP